jgi:hypothetical protein
MVHAKARLIMTTVRPFWFMLLGSLFAVGCAASDEGDEDVEETMEALTVTQGTCQIARGGEVYKASVGINRVAPTAKMHFRIWGVPGRDKSNAEIAITSPTGKGLLETGDDLVSDGRHVVAPLRPADGSPLFQPEKGTIFKVKVVFDFPFSVRHPADPSCTVTLKY